MKNHLQSRAKSLLLALALLATSAVCQVAAQTYLIDFGATSTPTTNGVDPNDPAHFWNNVTADIGTSSTGQLSNLVTTANFPSQINLVMLSQFNGANESGTVDPTLYPPNATRDSLFGNTELFGTLSNVFPSFKLTGLDAATAYTFTFYASRNGVGDSRETGYTVVGATTNFTALDPANNLDVTATAADIKPSAAGEISISLAPTENNNNGNHFTYLGVLRIDAVPPQTPLAFTKEPVSQRVIEFLPVTFSATVSGSPPYFVQWLNNGVPIPDANQFTYSISSATGDMNGSKISVTVSNLAYSVTSSNAVLQVITDTSAPTLVSASSANGLVVELLFNEPLDLNSVADAASFTVNGQSIIGSELRADGKTVALSLAERISGSFTVVYNHVKDLAGNEVAANSTATGTVPVLAPPSFLFDFGAGGTSTENGPTPDDPVNFWNNVTDSIGASEGGQMFNLVLSDGTTTDAGLLILSRFNGANANGTTAAAPFATDATRDSLYGNTEAFNGISDIFPSFVLTGLDPAQAYDFTFYASRTGVGDVRETGYTVTGATTGFAILNAANNVTNVARVNGISPSELGEITVSLAPTAANNNANHFTYLGAMKVQTASAVSQFQTTALADGKVTLSWTGTGQLESAVAVNGPWTAVLPAPSSPYTVTVSAGEKKFFRLKK